MLHIELVDALFFSDQKLLNEKRPQALLWALTDDQRMKKSTVG